MSTVWLGADLLARDFYTRKIDTVPSLVVLPLNHPLASEERIAFSQLKNNHFLRVSDTCAPGHNQKITEFCRRFGKFKPRFAAMRDFDNLAEGLSAAANEDEISINPIFISHLKIPNVVMVPIADTEATWDASSDTERDLVIIRFNYCFSVLTRGFTALNGLNIHDPATLVQQSNSQTCREWPRCHHYSSLQLLGTDGARLCRRPAAARGYETSPQIVRAARSG